MSGCYDLTCPVWLHVNNGAVTALPNTSSPDEFHHTGETMSADCPIGDSRLRSPPELAFLLT